MKKQSFEKWINEQIKETGVTIAQLAKKTKVSRVTVYSWKYGRSFPHVDAWLEIARLVAEHREIDFSIVMVEMSELTH